MTISPEWFREWFDSPYYHKLYFEHNEEEASAFISRLLGLLHPSPGSRMLDVACGRGRHSRILAEKGFDVTGIDLAADSIALARRYETDRLHFYLHDMRSPMRINYFDYAFNFFTSFGYFRTEREHDSTIRAVSQSLVKGGNFVLDYLNVQYSIDHLVNQSTKEIGDTVYRLTKWDDKKHFYKKIHIEDPALDAPLEFTERVAKFSLEDFTAVFSRHGLELRDVYGDYALGAYDRKASPRLLLIAEKK
ncbi:MAG TPA: methyltransferase domain-containing protein [Puia sp.]|nr:methyltransferase domain-containing protein [Puia sp.]